MGSETFEQLMALLKELAVLKVLDEAYEANPTGGEHEAYRVRQQRHEEIAAEIKALAKQSQESGVVGGSLPRSKIVPYRGPYDCPGTNAVRKGRC